MSLTDTPRRLVAVIGVIGLSLGFHAGKAGLVWLIAGGERFADGLAGAFVDNNGYALGTCMIMPLLIVTAQNLHFLFEGRWPKVEVWARRAIYLIAALCTFTVIGTFSRGGFLSLCAGVLTFVALQRRRFTAFAGLGAVAVVALLLVPIPDEYVNRLNTIRTYEEIQEDSAMSRPHFWKVAMRMVEDHPFGIGLRQYEAAYDTYDFLEGRYGHKRSVHSSHFQVLAEIGYPGMAAWMFLFAWGFFAAVRIRTRSARPGLAPESRAFMFTAANGLLTSMAAFVVGGSFIALALNDVTWLTFALLSALDRWSLGEVRRAEAQVAMEAGQSGTFVAARADVSGPLGGRPAVEVGGWLAQPSRHGRDQYAFGGPARAASTEAINGQ